LDADLVTNFFSLNAPELNNILIKNQKAETFSKKFMDDVPFDLHSATIKHLKLSVPLSKIYSESVVITCKKVQYNAIEGVCGSEAEEELYL
jgi:hypothetical protein